MAAPAPKASGLYREIELDFVRGIAILMVLDFHATPQGGFLSYPLHLLGFPSFGSYGVSVFFVLSGFLVGGLLIKEWKTRGRIDSRRFLIRRALKIWPQYYVFLAVMLVSGHRSLQNTWGNLLNVQNYVGGVAHTWSLAVEEHAYLLLVLCLAIAARRRTRMQHFFLFIAGWALAVNALREYLYWHGYDVFSATHTRIDGILYGVLLAILYHYKPEIFHRLQNRWIWILSLAGILVFFRLNLHSWGSVVASYDIGNLLGVTLLMLLYRHRSGHRRNALYRFVAWIGVYSYGIYLWHVAVASTILQFGQRIPARFIPAWNLTVPIAAGAVAGIILTRLVEIPVLHLRDRWFPRRVDSAVGIPAEVEAAETASSAR